MEFIVKDTNFLPLAVADVYTSAIWTERMWEQGDFELVVPLGMPIVKYLVPGNYLTLKDTDRAMIIESMLPESDISDGSRIITYKGRSLESILERRIVWKRTHLSGNLVLQIKKLMEDNIGVNAGDKRKISNFRFVMPGNYTDAERQLNAFEIDAEYHGETLYEVMTSIGEAYNIGWKITLSYDNFFEMRLYVGTDRTTQQVDRDPVIFSPEYDTLINSKYLYDTSPYKNLVLVLGEEKENKPRVQRTVYNTDREPTGLDRRELFENASGIRQEDDDGNELTDAEYEKVLDYHGLECLSEHVVAAVFDGEVETALGAQYGTGYKMGDYVVAINEFGMGSVAQIREYIRSFDENGYSAYPSFVMIG